MPTLDDFLNTDFSAPNPQPAPAPAPKPSYTLDDFMATDFSDFQSPAEQQFMETPEQFGPPNPLVGQGWEQKSLGPIAPAAPQYDLSKFSSHERKRLDPDLLRGRYVTLKDNPTLQGMTQQQILERAAEELLYRDLESSANEQYGRVRNTAQDEALQQFSPLSRRETGLGARSDEESVQRAMLESIDQTGTDQNWRSFYRPQQDLPMNPREVQSKPDDSQAIYERMKSKERKYENPQEQELYDKVKRQVLRDLLDERSGAQYKKGLEQQADEEARNTLGMRASRALPPVLSDIARQTGLGLTDVGTGIGSIPYNVADWLGVKPPEFLGIDGESMAKDIGDTSSRLDRASEVESRDSVVPASVRSAYRSAVSSVASAGAGALLKTGSIATNVARSVSSNYSRNRAEGMDRGTALINAAGSGAMEGLIAKAFAKAGLRGTEGQIDDIISGAAGARAKDTFAAALAKTILEELPEEAITEELQKDWDVLTKGTGARGLSERLDDQLQVLLSTVMAGGAATATQRAMAQQIADADGPPSRSQLAKFGIKDPTSIEEREAIKARIQKQLLESQPELATADPNKTVGAEFNTPLSKRPAEQPMPAEEFDRVIQDANAKFQRNFPTQAEDPLGLDSPKQDNALEKERFIAPLVDKGYSRENAEEQWNRLRGEDSDGGAQKEAPAQPVTSEKPAPEASVNPQDFELPPKTEVQQKAQEPAPEPELVAETPSAEVDAKSQEEKAQFVENLIGKGFSQDYAEKQWRQSLSDPASISSDLGVNWGKKTVEPRESAVKIAPTEVSREVESMRVPAEKAQFVSKMKKAGYKAEKIEADWAKTQEGRQEAKQQTEFARKTPKTEAEVGANIPLNMPTDKQADVKPIGNIEIVENLRKRFNIPIRKGRIAQRAAAAIYKKFPQVARTKVAGDLGPITHEIAHHIDNIKGGNLRGPGFGLSENAPPNVQRALERLDYDQNKQRNFEGFAEFTRQYLTGEDLNTGSQRAKDYQTVKQWFESEVLPKDAELKAKLDETRAEVDRYKAQGAEQRIKQSMSKGVKPATGLSKMLSNAYRSLVSSGESLAKVSPAAYKQYLSMNRMGGLEAAKAIEKGVKLPSGSVIGKPFQHVLEPLRKNGEAISTEEMDNWQAWVKARHALEMIDKSIDPGIEAKDAQYTYDKGNGNQAWVEAADRLTQWNNDLLEVLVDAGLKTRQEVDLMKKAWKTYIPMTRVQEEFLGSGLTHKGIEPGDPIKRRKGGGEATLSPVQATFEKAVKIYDAAAKAAVLNKLIGEAVPNWGDSKASTATPGLGAFVEEVPANQRKKYVNMENVREQLESYGIDTSAIPEGELLEYWTPNLEESKGERIISLINPRTNKKTLIKLDNDLYEVVKGMDTLTAPALIRGMAMFSDLARAGITTLNPAQPAANFTKDYPAYLFNTRSSWLNPKTFADPFINTGRYVYSEILRAMGKQPLADVKAWQDSGGEILVKVARDRESISRKVKDVMASPSSRQRYLIADSPIEFVQKIISMADAGPRLSEFKSYLKEKGYDAKSGNIPEDVLVEAIHEANDITVDFSRHGNAYQWLRTVPFLNAGIQGADKLVRTFKEHPKRTLLRGLGMSAATLAYWLSRHEDDDYEEQEDWLKYGFWTATDETGKVVARLPRTEGYGFFFSALPEAMLNSLKKKDAGQLMGSLKQLQKSVPAHDIPGITGMVEVYTGYDFFTGKPIVDQFTKDSKTREQWTRQETTELAKRMGEAIGESPAYIEHLLDDVTGGGFSGMAGFFESRARAMKSEDEPSPASAVAKRLSMKRENSKSMTEFYEQAAEARRKAGSEATDEAKDKARMYDRFKSVIGEMREIIAKEKDRDKRFEVEKYMIGLARRASGEQPLARYPDPLSDKKLPVRIKNAVGNLIGTIAAEAAAEREVKLNAADRRLGGKRTDVEGRKAEKQDAVADAVKELQNLGVTKEEAAQWLEWKKRQSGESQAAINKAKNRLMDNFR